VSVKADLPTAVSNVITLVDAYTYIIVDPIDLTGDRIVLGTNTVLEGFSPDNCFLTSTGLGASTPLLTSTTNVYIANITINNVGLALDLNAGTSTDVIEMSDVHFEGCTDMGAIDGYDHQLYLACDFGDAIDDVGTLTFTGSVHEITFQNCIMHTAAGKIGLHLLGGLTVIDRFQVLFSSWEVPATATGIQIETAATIPTEGLNLIATHFGDAGTYVNDITPGNHAHFADCTGLKDSVEVSHYYMTANATATTIAVTSTPVKVAGTTVNDAITEKFTNSTTNRATYTGAITRDFTVQCVVSLESGNNKDIEVYVYKNGSASPGSSSHITTSGTGKGENVVVQSIVELATNDYVEIWVANDDDTTDVTVTALNMIIHDIA
jgi:hypothetical protein